MTINTFNRALLISATLLATSINVSYAMAPVADSQESTATQAATANKKTMSKNDIVTTLCDIALKTAEMPAQIKLMVANLNSEEFSETTVIDLAGKMLALSGHTLSPEQQKLLKDIKNALTKKLKSYKASGCSFAIDANGAFFVDTVDPQFTVTFKDPKGNILTRKYKAAVELIGFNVEFAIRPTLIFMTGDVNFYDTNKTIELGTGVEISPTLFLKAYSFGGFWRRLINFAMEHPYGASPADEEALMRSTPWIEKVWATPLSLTFTYAPFKNTSGGIFMVSVPTGYTTGSLSLVRGGTLTPVA